MAKKCARCKHELVYFTKVLWNGPNGFRRYDLCDKCKKAVEKESKPKTKAPLCPVHKRRMEWVTVRQGDKLLGSWWECKVKDCDQCMDEEEVAAEATPIPRPLSPTSGERGAQEAQHGTR